MDDFKWLMNELVTTVIEFGSIFMQPHSHWAIKTLLVASNVCSVHFVRISPNKVNLLTFNL